MSTFIEPLLNLRYTMQMHHFDIMAVCPAINKLDNL